MSSSVRVAGAAAWQVLLFLINGTVFILIGVQLPSMLAGLSDRSAAELIGMAAIISAVVIVVRILWVFPGTYVPRALSKAIRESEPYPPPTQRLHRLVGRDARRRVARGCAGPAAHARRRVTRSPSGTS